MSTKLLKNFSPKQRVPLLSFSSMNSEDKDDEYSQPWPPGLFAAGIIALLVLAAGGYGVLEQRLEMQREVRLLTAKLATTTSNREVAQDRQAQRSLQAYNEDLQAQIQLLQSKITGLYEELNRTKSEAAAHPATMQGVWFVNFGSYKSEATAKRWASRLSVDAWNVSVVSGEKKGTLYYRVRVLDLPNKEIAEKIALQLAQTYHLSPLWVGKQQ